VNGLVDFARLRYAVIEALRTEADPECFVISYRTSSPCTSHSRTLHYRFRLLLSREAEASINVCVSATAA